MAGTASSTGRGSVAPAPSPADPGLEAVSLKAAAKRAVSQFRAHQMTDNAAALTYYAMLSLFPMILIGISLLGLVGQASTITDAVDYVAKNGADPETQTILRETMQKLLESSEGKVGFALVIGILVALNGASGAFGAAGRALNVVHAVEEDRSFVRRKITDVVTTVVVLLLLVIGLVSVLLGGGIAGVVFDVIGLGSTAETVWSIARWPVALLAVIAAFAIVYAVAPDVPARRPRWFSPGAIAAVLLWIVLSILFAVYVKTLGSYGEAYGAIGGVIVLLLWLWLTSCAFLFGGELNKEIERSETAGRAAPPFPSPPPSPGDPAGTASAPTPARDADADKQ